jgi:hypothetical protein
MTIDAHRVLEIVVRILKFAASLFEKLLEEDSKHRLSDPPK